MAPASFMFPRGSEWRKWDLHAHTPLDSEWHGRPPLDSDADKAAFAAAYVKRACEVELACIAITDHNFCRSATDLLIPFIQREARGTNVTVLPGFETTVADCGGTHVLVIFSEGTDLQAIDKVVDQLFPPGTQRFQAGGPMPTMKGIGQLHEILLASKMCFLLAFAHAEADDGVLGRGPGQLRAALWRQPCVHIAQVRRPPHESGNFIASVANGSNACYSRDMTYIVASDCRALTSDGLPEGRHSLGERFSWIKADPCFEGLRQIVFEPLQRVRLQEHRPEQKPAIHTIERVRFIDPSNTFQADPIPVSQYLTAIIGGKSTGKSLLLSCIAHAVDAVQAQSVTDTAKTNKYELRNVDFEVVWSTGDVDRLSQGNGSRPITYLPQMFVHELADSRESLTDRLLVFLRQNPDFERDYQALLAERGRIVAALASEVLHLFSVRSNYVDVASQIRSTGDRTATNAELARNAQRADALRAASGFSEDETRLYEELQAQRSAEEDRAATAQQFAAALPEMSSRVLQATQVLSRATATIPVEVSASRSLASPQADQLAAIAAAFTRSIEAAVTIFSEDVARLSAEAEREEARARAALEEIAVKQAPLLDKIRNQGELNELRQAAAQMRQSLEQLERLEQERRGLETQHGVSVARLRELVVEHVGVMKRLVGLMNDQRYSDVGGGIVISAGMTFNQEEFASEFLSHFDQRVPLSRLGACLGSGSLEWSPDAYASAITGILERLLDMPEDELKLRANHTRQAATETLLRDYLGHTLTATQNGEDIARMSPGKQGLVLLELFLHLSNSNYPILIDQPEDNLDNRTVYSHLVEYIRKKKIQRQIIIVTHNPNLVVGADAEQVIVANQDGEGGTENAKFTFEYVSGALECSFASEQADGMLESCGIREHVCQILEGGTDAFRKREQRYNLSQIKMS